MPKYRVYLETVASTTVEIEADDKDAAYEAALSEDMPTLCAHCSGMGQGRGMDMAGDWDLPRGMSVDESVEEIG